MARMTYAKACLVASETWNYYEDDLRAALDTIKTKRGTLTRTDLADMQTLKDEIHWRIREDEIENKGRGRYWGW